MKVPPNLGRNLSLAVAAVNAFVKGSDPLLRRARLRSGDTEITVDPKSLAKPATATSQD
jgi:hypothetical protein